MDLNDKIWNPWHGCHRCSEGCQNCYAYFLDKRYGRDTNEIVRNKLRCRPDVTFSLLTKRAERIEECLPYDWGDGWDNVSFSVSCENQKRLEQRMPYLLEVPAKHRWVSLKPFIGEIDIADYLATGKIETVLAGGENYLGSRPLHYEWVKKVYDACKQKKAKRRGQISLLRRIRYDESPQMRALVISSRFLWF